MIMVVMRHIFLPPDHPLFYIFFIYIFDIDDDRHNRIVFLLFCFVFVVFCVMFCKSNECLTIHCLLNDM